MRIYKKNLLLVVLSVLLAVSSNSQPVRQIINFNEGWKFYLGDTLASATKFNDSKWRSLQLPHDWSIEGNFSSEHTTTTQGGALPAGVGWYRKSFQIPAGGNNKNITIEFDGVYCNSQVWINGHNLGIWPYGYTSFSYNLTPYILPAPQRNVIAIKVDNSKQPNSRWYSGSGIYRNVRLVVTGSIAVKKWGQFITTPIVGEKQATIRLQTVIANTADITKDVKLVTKIFNAAGKQVGLKNKAGEAIVNVKKGETEQVQEFELNLPRLWSVNSPHLYKAITQLWADGKIIDEISETFGIRYFSFDKDKGFFLNGEPLKILGVCNHHDLGALGAAVNERAIERQLEILKKMGVNAIRTAHNPPAPELLTLCDKMGFLVMDEAFDMWAKKKNKYDYFSYFNEWHQKDLEAMVLRDRNHPSVFMWSVGNEIREQFDSTGISITRELVNIVKKIDSTRPVTAGLSEWNPEKNYMYKAGALDVVGLNYHHEVYEDFQKHYPGQIFLGSENMSAFATRGHYSFPSDSTYFWPAASPQKIVENGNPDYTVSAYDQVSAYWGSTHETTWKIIKKHAFLSGLFVWSGFDFIGEPIPYPWPARSSYYGIIDLAGFPKDVYYMYQSEWTTTPVLHIFPHWNWQPGQWVDVWAYYNNADEVELFLNGESLGVKNKQNDDLHVMWRVPFTQGTLKAITRKNGKKVLEKEIRTAGKPVKIILTADRARIKADGKDLSFITATIVDANNNIVPTANNELRWEITGAGKLAATDNGYQADTISFKSPVRKSWKGLSLGIVQALQKKGSISVKVSAATLQAAVINIKVE